MSGAVALAVIMVLVCTQTAHCQVAKLLSKINAAPTKVSYQGTKVTSALCDSHQLTAVIRVDHQKPNITRIEFIKPQRINGTIILSKNGSLWRYIPSQKVWFEIASKSENVHDIDQEILWNYNVKIIGDGIVANRKVIIIKALPRLQGDLIKKVWVDKQHFIIMRLEAYAPDGRIVHSSHFISVNFKPHFTPDQFRINGKAIKHDQVRIAFRVLTPSYIPKGYRLVKKGPVVAGGHSSFHLFYSNGIGGFSLFQWPLVKGEKLPKPPKIVGANMLIWVSRGRGFVAFGDISISDLKKISQSIKP